MRDMLNFESWSVIIAAVGGVVSIISATVAVVVDRKARKLMKMKQLYELRDIAIKNSIVRRLGPEIAENVFKQIDDAFAEGNEVWEQEFLGELFSAPERTKILERIDTETAQRVNK